MRLRKRYLFVKTTVSLDEGAVVVVCYQTRNLLFLDLLNPFNLTELLPIPHDLSFFRSQLKLITFQHLLEHLYFISLVLKIKLYRIHLLILELFKPDLLDFKLITDLFIPLYQLTHSLQPLL